MESLYVKGHAEKTGFSISVPRASYITHAFTNFVKNIDISKPIEFNYKETNSMRAIKNILQEGYTLGIIRYQRAFEAYFDALMKEKGITGEQLGEFSYLALMSDRHPLAGKPNITYNDLTNYIEITHGDPFVPYLPMTDVKKAEQSDKIDKRIFVYERGSQFDLLSEVCSTFMWVSPIPEAILKRNHLVQRSCAEADRKYVDVLIHKKAHKFSTTEKAFIKELERVKNETFSRVKE